MIKSYKQGIGDFFIDIVSKPVRKKKDLILLLLETVKLFITYGKTEVTATKGIIILRIDKMNRIFYQIENKIFSFQFPFSIDENGDSLLFRDSVYNINITAKLVSVLISYFYEDNVSSYLFDEIYDLIDNLEKEFNIEQDELQIILKKLLSFEVGYIRYDIDEKNSNGDIHPLNHLDIYYSDNATFKIGLHKACSVENFIDILDINTNCYYIEKLKLD